MNKMNKRGHLALTIVLVALGDAFLGCAGVRDESGGRNMAATTAPYGASLESPTGAPVQATIAMEAISLNKISSMALDPTGQRVYIGAAAEDEKAALLVGTMTATGVAAVQRFRVLDPAVQPATAFTASVTGLVVDATKRKLYASIRYSQPVTANLLTVYDLDSALVPTGAPRNYPASFGSTWAWSIARHPTQPALYTSGWTGVYRHTLNPATGEPTGAAAFFAVAPGAYVTDLAVRGSKLYFGTEVASARLRVVDLDASGAPQLDARGAPVVRSFSFTSPDGCYAPGVGLRFALGANAIYVRPPLRTDATPAIPEFCQLAVWSLQASGEPASAPAFSAAVTMSDVTYSATGAVYLAVPSIALDADLGPMREGMSIARASVDTQGQLAGAPQVVSATDVGARLGLMVAASDNGAAALATLAGGVRTRRPNFDKDWRVRVSLIAADINNQPAAAGTTYSADFTDADQTLQLMPVTVNRFPASPLTVGGAPSGWISLDAFYWNRQTGPILKDKGRLFVFLVNVGAVQNVAGVGGFSRLTVRIDLGRGNAGGGVDVLKSVTDTLQGTIVSFVLPGYAYRTPAGVGGASTLLDAFETLTGHAERLRGIAAEARDAGPSVNTRPQLFPVSCGAIIGNQDSVPMLDALLGTISDLGCNVTLTNYFTGLPVATINERLAANGLKQNLHAGNYFPAQAGGAACGIDSSRAMTYFDFQATPSQLACWASGSATTYAGAYGGQPEDVRLFMLGDEPQFDLPAADPTAFSWVREVASTPELLAKFRTYLQHQVNDPTYFGAANWHDIFPLDPTDPTVAPPSDAGVMSTVTNAADLARHHLAYHTVRYFVEAATNGVRQTSQAIHARFPNALPYVNWNAVSLEWVSNWYTSGKANFDWFEHGRANAGTLWTEDWMTDQRASIWSYYANAMRSAASLGQQEFGGYIVGQTLAYSGVEDGASYRLLGLVGHGAKAVEWYNYGPSLFDDDAWSESIGAYAPIAAANQRLAAAERLLYPGRPSRGAVAIQHSATSNLWDVWQGGTRFPAHYQWETGYLYYALMHAGVRVDFVDDTDIAQNLESRGYTTLYIVKPNVSFAAQQAIERWVRAGGTLVALPGAGTADEFNATFDATGQSTAILEPVLGLSTAARRAATIRASGFTDPWSVYRTSVLVPRTATMTFTNREETDPNLGAGAMNIYGDVVTDLVPGTAATGVARVLATMNVAATGATANAITVNAYGAGRAVAYGFFAGFIYYSSANHQVRRGLPTGWDARARQLVVAPILAATPNPVSVNVPLVEALRLDSRAGTAVVLLNWSGAPLSSVTVTVPGVRSEQSGSSIEQRAVASARDAVGNRTFTLSLRTVDVLMIE